MNRSPVSAPSVADTLDAGEAMFDVSRGTELELVWDRGAPGVFMQVQGQGQAPDGDRSLLTCVFESEQGRGAVPAELLEAFPGDRLELLTTVAAEVEWDIGVLQVGAVREVLLPDKALRLWVSSNDSRTSSSAAGRRDLCGIVSVAR